MLYDENNNYFDIVSNELEYEYDINKYVDKSKYNDIDINIDSINFNRNEDLYSPMEGFNKGNMFSDMYSRYKNHVYKLKVTNDRDMLLYKIQMYNFAMKDMNLYLDIYPDDKKMLSNFQEYKKMYNELKNKYENVYGPLCVKDVVSSDKWTWIDNPWPWDKGGN